MEPILEVKDLSKAFHRPGKPDYYAVDHVSFSLFPGEVLGIVGESGSGKSTVAKLLTRLIDPTGGSICIHGQEITALHGRALRPVYEQIQMVFQTPAGSFDPRRTLGDGIGESLRCRGVPRKKALQRSEELLEQCGLPKEFSSRYPYEVSGGQCQRAAIARALAAEPQILILDEATSALDVTVQKQILALLAEIRRDRGLSYLFICHNLALVQQLCSRVLVMAGGKIVEQGTVDQVILHPQAEYTRLLVEAAM